MSLLLLHILNLFVISGIKSRFRMATNLDASIDPEPQQLPTWPEGPEGRVGHFRHSRRRRHLYLSFTSTSSYLNNYDVKRAFG